MALRADRHAEGIPGGPGAHSHPQQIAMAVANYDSAASEEIQEKHEAFYASEARSGPNYIRGLTDAF